MLGMSLNKIQTVSSVQGAAEDQVTVDNKEVQNQKDDDPLGKLLVEDNFSWNNNIFIFY